MSSKVFIFLGLFLALVLLISSEVAANDLAETSVDTNKEDTAGESNGVEEAKYGGYNQGGRGGYNNGGGYRGGGGYNNGGGYPGRGGGRYNGGGYCRYGCCGNSYRGCRRCCSYAGEAATTTTPGN